MKVYEAKGVDYFIRGSTPCISSVVEVLRVSLSIEAISELGGYVELRDAAVLVSAAVSAQSLFLAAIVAWLNDARSKRASQLSMLAYTDSVDSNVRTWGIDVVRLLDEAISLCMLDPLRVQGESFLIENCA
jgi:hypothetical protein